MSLAVSSRVTRALLWCCSIVAVFTLVSPSRAQTFEVLWGASSGGPEDGETWDTWEEWDRLVDLGNTGIRRDRAIFLYQSEFGVYPYAGPQQILLDPTWMVRHRALITFEVNARMPDPNYDGLAIIDYENWGFTWDTTVNIPSNGGPYDADFDFKDDWKAYIQQHEPWRIAGLTGDALETAYRNRYNQVVRDYIVETIRFAKTLRPRAKWGYYLIPYRSYYDAQDLTNFNQYQGFLNQEIGWLYPEQDAFFPDIYSLFLTEGDEQSSMLPYRDLATPYTNYLTGNIQWAQNAAQGRPVYPCISMRYHPSSGPYTNQFVNAINMQYPIRIADQLNAQGVVIWEVFGSTLQQQRYQTFVDGPLRPFLASYLDRCKADFVADRAVTIDDLLDYLGAFGEGRVSADLTDHTMGNTMDGAVDVNDLLYFLGHFAGGC